MTFEFVSEFLGSKQEEHASGQLTDCFPASVLTSLRLRLFVLLLYIGCMVSMGRSL